MTHRTNGDGRVTICELNSCEQGSAKRELRMGSCELGSADWYSCRKASCEQLRSPRKMHRMMNILLAGNWSRGKLFFPFSLPFYTQFFYLLMWIEMFFAQLCISQIQIMKTVSRSFCTFYTHVACNTRCFRQFASKITRESLACAFIVNLKKIKPYTFIKTRTYSTLLPHQTALFYVALE